MKSGASDPFADDEPSQTDDEPADAGDESATADTDGTATQVTSAEAATTADDDTDDGVAAEDDDDADVTALSREELPFILRRDKVKDERPEVHQLFVQAGTHERAVDAERELEDMLGVDLSRTDAREAIYLAGMQHLDEAADVLRRWGYDM